MPPASDAPAAGRMDINSAASLASVRTCAPDAPQEHLASADVKCESPQAPSSPRVNADDTVPSSANQCMASLETGKLDPPSEHALSASLVTSQDVHDDHTSPDNLPDSQSHLLQEVQRATTSQSAPEPSPSASLPPEALNALPSTQELGKQNASNPDADSTMNGLRHSQAPLGEDLANQALQSSFASARENETLQEAQVEGPELQVQQPAEGQLPIAAPLKQEESPSANQHLPAGETGTDKSNAASQSPKETVQSAAIPQGSSAHSTATASDPVQHSQEASQMADNSQAPPATKQASQSLDTQVEPTAPIPTASESSDLPSVPRSQPFRSAAAATSENVSQDKQRQNEAQTEFHPDGTHQLRSSTAVAASVSQPPAQRTTLQENLPQAIEESKPDVGVEPYSSGPIPRNLPKTAKHRPNNARVFVGNLASEFTNAEEMTRIFYKYGELIEEPVLRRSFGFIQYATAEAAARAVKGEQGLVIGGIAIDLSIADNREVKRGTHVVNNTPFPHGYRGRNGPAPSSGGPPNPRVRGRDDPYAQPSNSRKRRRSLSPNSRKGVVNPPHFRRQRPESRTGVHMRILCMSPTAQNYARHCEQAFRNATNLRIEIMFIVAARLGEYLGRAMRDMIPYAVVVASKDVEDGTCTIRTLERTGYEKAGRGNGVIPLAEAIDVCLIDRGLLAPPTMQGPVQDASSQYDARAAANSNCWIRSAPWWFWWHASIGYVYAFCTVDAGCSAVESSIRCGHARRSQTGVDVWGSRSSRTWRASANASSCNKSIGWA